MRPQRYLRGPDLERLRSALHTTKGRHWNSPGRPRLSSGDAVDKLRWTPAAIGARSRGASPSDGRHAATARSRSDHIDRCDPRIGPVSTPEYSPTRLRTANGST